MALDLAQPPEKGTGDWQEYIENNFKAIQDYAKANDLSISDAIAALGNMANYNYIINGDFRIWQRDEGLSGTGYTADRFYLQGVYAGSRTVAKALNAFGKNETSIKIIDVSSTGEINFEQRVEHAEIFAGKTMTLSFDVLGEGMYNIQYLIYLPSLSNMTLANGFTNITTTTQRKIITFAVPENATGVLTCRILRSGSNNHTIYIANVKLEIGDKATPFVPRPFAEELALCQRYYEVVAYSATPSAMGQTTVAPTFYATTKRILPYISFSSDGITADGKCKFWNNSTETLVTPDAYIHHTVSGLSVVLSPVTSPSYDANYYGYVIVDAEV